MKKELNKKSIILILGIIIILFIIYFLWLFGVLEKTPKENLKNNIIVNNSEKPLTSDESKELLRKLAPKYPISKEKLEEQKKLLESLNNKNPNIPSQINQEDLDNQLKLLEELQN